MAGQPFPELGTAALNGDLYVNIHTEQNPNGEIRGQIQIQRGLLGTSSTFSFLDEQQKVKVTEESKRDRGIDHTFDSVPGMLLWAGLITYVYPLLRDTIVHIHILN